MASLADIMSQQLAQQLADADRHAAESAERERSAALAAEQAAIASATASVEAGAADAAEAAGEADSLAEDADTRLARALQAAYDAETGHWPAEVPGSSVPAGTGSSTEDQDLAMAMHLQELEHSGGSASVAAQNAWRTRPAPERKVYSADDWEAARDDAAADAIADAEREREAALASAAQLPDGEEPDEEEEAGEFAATRGTAFKHDKRISGRRNVRQLDRDFTSHTGALADLKGASGRGLELSNRVASDLRRHFARGTVKGMRAHGRLAADHRATRDAVLDQSTRLLLFRLVSMGAVGAVSGVLRTGKEASILHASDWAGADDSPYWKGMTGAARSVVPADTASVGGTTAPDTGRSHAAAHDPSPEHAGREESDEEDGDGEDGAASATGGGAGVGAAAGSAEEVAGADALFDAMADLSERKGPREGAAAAGAGCDDDEDDADDVGDDVAAASAGEAGAGGETAGVPSAVVTAALAEATARAEREASSPGLPEVAVKVFRTTLNEFSNRFDYMDGDRRYRHARRHRNHNPRKLVKLWSRKEYANLYRIYQAGLPCPQPHLHRENILVMDFLGEDAWPAPQLREAQIRKRSTWRRALDQTVSIMHGLWHCARLVHGDLSEFNLLWHKRRVWVIDVGQAVELTHPDADSFLLRDCENIRGFFARQGVAVPTASEMADLVRDDTIPSVFRPRRSFDLPSAPTAGAAAGEEHASAAVGSGDDAVANAFRAMLAAAAAAAASPRTDAVPSAAPSESADA
ncbi:hypothetical protein FNF28_00230 [Cafeteria roenbergensis]|uniref:non-specific serine/threonine protein kinase n=1 Tax=Cafeteria roenbergensis TaxID=33653 RepID=A0A5A8E5V6_CAFRO|nr:hypothetical protein FNF28_00230 [Cafeteria roenbergensis]